MLLIIADNNNGAIIVFDIKQDVSGTDPTVRQNVKNGDTFSLSAGDNLYIANPTNAGGHTFTVTFVPA